MTHDCIEYIDEAVKPRVLKHVETELPGVDGVKGDLDATFGTKGLNHNDLGQLPETVVLEVFTRTADEREADIGTVEVTFDFGVDDSAYNRRIIPKVDEMDLDLSDSLNDAVARAVTQHLVGELQADTRRDEYDTEISP